MTEDEIRAHERRRIGTSILKVADDLLHAPESDGVDGHVSAVLRDLGTMLVQLSGDDLILAGLEKMASDIRAQTAAAGRS